MSDEFIQFLDSEIVRSEQEMANLSDGYMRMVFVGQLAAFKAIKVCYVAKVKAQPLTDTPPAHWSRPNFIQEGEYRGRCHDCGFWDAATDCGCGLAEKGNAHG